MIDLTYDEVKLLGEFMKQIRCSLEDAEHFLPIQEKFEEYLRTHMSDGTPVKEKN